MTKKKTSKLHDTYTRLYTEQVGHIVDACFVQAMRECPQATLHDVIVLADELGVAHRVNFMFTAKPKTIPLVAEEASGAPKLKARTRVSTRTPAERAAFDEAVRSAIAKAGTWVRAEAFRLEHFPGVTPMQLRKACNRLIRDGKLVYQGQARGTEYKAS